MRFHYSASALALITSTVLAQECPPGYEKSKLVWEDCPVKDVPTLQCATLPVPLDYSKPAGDILKLRLVRIPAVSTNSGTKSILFNPGGPGSAGIDFLISGNSGIDTQKLVGTNFHLVGFDPRGTGLSIPFECPYLNRTRDLKDTDSNIQRVYNALSLQANKCAEPDYKTINGLIGTAYVARDMKAIAEALGEDGLIRYLGVSYGTLLGATTAAMFPDSIGRMVLDGNINPKDYYYGLGAEALADVDKAIARFFDLCAEAGPSNCAVAVSGQSGAQLLQRFDNFLNGLTYDQSYVVRGNFFGNLYDPSTFKNQAVFLQRYYTNSSRIPRRSLHRRADGDEDEWEPTDSSEVDTPLALQGITCGDWILEPEASVPSFKEWLGLYKDTSKYAGDQALLTTTYQCALWKNEANEKFRGSFSGVKTKNPILFVNTLYDPVTPLVSAQNSSSGFIGSRLLVSSGGGHLSSAQPSKDLDDAIRQYFVDASFPVIQKTYTPDKPNSFLTARTNTTTTKRRKRNTSHPYLFDHESTIVRRQSTIPVGCVKKNSTSVSSMSTMSSSRNSSTVSTMSSSRNSTTMTAGGYGGYPGRSSTRLAGYGNNGASSSTRRGGYGDSSNSASTRPAGYANYAGNPTASARSSMPTPGSNGYGYGYPGSPASSMTSPAGSVPSGYIPITKTITETACETVTKCPDYGACSVGSVITRTSVRTTIVTVPASASNVVVTVKSAASSMPGQGYNVPQTWSRSWSASGSHRSHQMSRSAASSAPAASNPVVYGTPAKVSSAVVVASSVLRVTNSVATPVYNVPTNGVSSVRTSNATRPTGSPTGNYPAQFTGAAANNRAVLSCVGFIVALASFTFML